MEANAMPEAAGELRKSLDMESRIYSGDRGIAATTSHAVHDDRFDKTASFTIQFPTNEQKQQEQQTPGHYPIEEDDDKTNIEQWNDDDDADEDNDILTRPILVGYAFGPKKMSTMGVVMAEASRTALSTLATTVLVEEADEDELASDQDTSHDGHNMHDNRGYDRRHSYASAPIHDDHEVGCPSNIPGSANQQQFKSGPLVAAEEGSPTENEVPDRAKSKTSSQDSASGDRNAGVADTVNTGPCSSISSSPRRNKPIEAASRTGNDNIMLSLDSYSGGLKNIVRYLHSSCSSVDTNSTNTTTLTTGTSAFNPSSCGNKLGAASTHSGKGSTSGSHQRLLRVSFVPLDPDLPLEGQHGAKVDVILHKLTEDILCLSKFTPLYPDLMPRLGVLTGNKLETHLKKLQPPLPQDAQEGILRVHRLMRYQKKNPHCLLADDPRSVLTLMSRSAIAHALSKCLVGVTSASGIPVSSPKFVVWDRCRDPARDSTTAEMSQGEGDGSVTLTELIAQRLRRANMSYPIIAKPLQAAGTKLSHRMTVLLNESSLRHIDTSSCLLQEYANHDAVLYKVYVLGKNVRVYQRPSLPNLPPLDIFADEGGDGEKRVCPSYVDFDSQRPYPRLSAFGVAEGKYAVSGTSPPAFLSSLAKPTAPHPRVAVTASEVQPIVDTLKRAFGLELFGFDILIASGAGVGGDACDNSSRKRMYVVDVNYFPSYKEVSDFPSLLAQYLTQRAVDSRRRKAQSNKGSSRCSKQL